MQVVYIASSDSLQSWLPLVDTVLTHKYLNKFSCLKTLKKLLIYEADV
jgi:hypothetical protein